MDENKLIGVCGLYCGACPHYRATQPDGEHLLQQALKEGRSPEDFTCGGCRSDSHYVHPGCVACEFRNCARDQELEYCGECGDQLCSELETFKDDGRPHHADIPENLTKLLLEGKEAWLAGMQERWRCSCGQHFSWYEECCQGCGEKLDSYGPDPGKKK